MDPSMSELVDSAAKAGLGIVAMKVMAGGQRRAASGGNEKTREILGREGAMLAALKWTLKNPNVHTTVPSITAISLPDRLRRAWRIDSSARQGRRLVCGLVRFIPCLLIGNSVHCKSQCPTGATREASGCRESTTATAVSG
jgi:hypothetical protein